MLQKHLLNQKINEGDIVIFFDGINENGNRNSRNTAFLYNMQKALNQKYWDIYKFTFPIFFESLTTSQLIKRFKEKLRINQKTILEQNNIFDLDEDLKNVFQKNINIRNGICKFNDLKCFNFLQPFATLHGKYFDKPISGAIENRVLNVNQKRKLLQKFNLLKNTKGIIDISNSLDNSKMLSYVDSVHYSPYANMKIAQNIYKIIFNNIDNKY